MVVQRLLRRFGNGSIVLRQRFDAVLCRTGLVEATDHAVSILGRLGRMTSTVMTGEPLSTRAASIGKTSTSATGQRPYYLNTEETEPARFDASLGWFMQIDCDNHRNAFLSSPWVKAILPMRPGREHEAIAFLQRKGVAGTEGLDEPLSVRRRGGPPEYKEVQLLITDKTNREYFNSLHPVPIGDETVSKSQTRPAYRDCLCSWIRSTGGRYQIQQGCVPDVQRVDGSAADASDCRD